MGKLAIFSGNSNLPLTQKICEYLDMPLGGAKVKTFSDGEIQIEIDENVRSKDVFIVQSTCHPVNDNLVELLLMIDAFKRSSSRRITAVIPYYGYARQDKKVAPRVPISAKLVANMLEVAGANRVITMDLHAGQIQGFFDIPTDNLFATKVMEDDIRRRYNTDNLLIVSPDVGGVVRARALAKRIEAPLSIVDKRRDKPGESEVMNIIGDVKGYDCILVDDIVDSGGTLCNAAEALLAKGAKSVTAYITHGVLSGGAVARVTSSKLKELVITNSIEPTAAITAAANIRAISIAPLIGEAINRTALEKSVSSLFG